MSQPIRRQRRLTRRIRHGEICGVVALVASSRVIVLEQIILFRIQNIPIRRRTLPNLINRNPNTLPISEKSIVRSLQDDALHLVGVAEISDVGFATEVLDFLVDDCSRGIWIPALGRSESVEVAGVRVENVGALRGPGV
jgi:hypothetical protein